jgi:uncharacterized protein (TIGR03437 family)
VRSLISVFVLTSAAYCADFTTYIGPPSVTQSLSIAALATDSAGDTYVTGYDAFVTKLDPAGNIVFTTSLGAAGSYGNAIAVDPAGNVWVGGEALGPDLPLVNALQSTGLFNGIGFLVKMTPDGTVLYSSYFGGTLGNSAVTGVATDPSGNVYVTGYTDASDFPTTPGLPASPVTGGGFNPVYGVFAAKLNSTGQKVLYSGVIAGAVNGSTCMGVSKTVGLGIAIDGAGNALMVGSTNCSDVPATAGGGSGPGPFVFKINAAGNQLVYLTYVGPPAALLNGIVTSTSFGTNPIAVDASGNAYLTGYTDSPDFEGTPGAYQTTYSGGANPEAFAVKLSPAGATIWATFLGSALNGSQANAVSLDSSDNVWVTGSNGPSEAPGSNFVDEVSADGSAALYGAQLPSGDAGQDIAVDLSGVVHFAGSTGLVSTMAPPLFLANRVLSILNAAPGTTTGLIAPGEVISIYGLGLSPTSAVPATPANGSFPTSLGGVQVLVNGNPIPLLYVSASQINAEVPSSVASGGLVNGIADVQVLYSVTEWDPVQQITVKTALPDFRVAVVGSDFGVFEKAGGSMAVINQDGTVNKLANPAKPGSIVSIWATGFGATGPPAVGAVATEANSFCSSCQLVLSNGATSVTETVEYAGTSPGLIDGLMQINFLIPTQFTSNGVWVYFTPPGYSQPLTLGWVEVAQ